MKTKSSIKTRPANQIRGARSHRLSGPINPGAADQKVCQSPAAATAAGRAAASAVFVDAIAGSARRVLAGTAKRDFAAADDPDRAAGRLEPVSTELSSSR